MQVSVAIVEPRYPFFGESHFAGYLCFIRAFLFRDGRICLAVERRIVFERVGVVPLPPHYLRKIEGNVENHTVNGNVGEDVCVCLCPEVRSFERTSGNERERRPWLAFLWGVTDSKPNLLKLLSALIVYGADHGGICGGEAV